MPESIVQVTEGVGKKLHTFSRVIGANTVEDEVGIQGEQYLASYVVTHGPTSIATANSHVTQIMAGASLKVRIRRIEVHQMAMATTAAMCNFVLTRLTSAGTGGTAITPSPLEAADGASGCTAMTLPTVLGGLGVQVGIGAAYLMQTVAASAERAAPLIVWDFDRPRSKPLIIAAGAANGIALRNVTAIAGATVTVMVWLDESSF